MFSKYRSRCVERSTNETSTNPAALRICLYSEGRAIFVVALRSVKSLRAFSSAPSAPIMSVKASPPPGLSARCSSPSSAGLEAAWQSTSHEITCEKRCAHSAGRPLLKSSCCTSIRPPTPSTRASDTFISFCAGEMLAPSTRVPSNRCSSACDSPPWPEPRSRTALPPPMGAIQSSAVSSRLFVSLDAAYTPSSAHLKTP
mmetsp:Transcript_17720/g.45315  ORF Transcript_17720/g.45315 Transcript_17720/m.45315 type:complete len:200 (-) Transcript_17720:206-805(-)